MVDRKHAQLYLGVRVATSASSPGYVSDGSCSSAHALRSSGGGQARSPAPCARAERDTLSRSSVYLQGISSLCKWGHASLFRVLDFQFGRRSDSIQHPDCIRAARRARRCAPLFSALAVPAGVCGMSVLEWWTPLNRRDRYAWTDTPPPPPTSPIHTEPTPTH